jgi:hypothetical protein
LLVPADIELARVAVERAAGRSREATAALNQAIGLLERAAALDPSLAVARRLAWARRSR